MTINPALIPLADELQERAKHADKRMVQAFKKALREAPKPQFGAENYQLIMPKLIPIEPEHVPELIQLLDYFGLIEQWLKLATIPQGNSKHTSPTAARELYALASLCLEHGAEMPDGLRRFLAASLGGVARSGDDNESLRAMRLKKGRCDPIEQHAKEERAAQMARLFFSGYPPAKVKQVLAYMFNTTERTIENWLVKK